LQKKKEMHFPYYRREEEKIENPAGTLAIRALGSDIPGKGKKGCFAISSRKKNDFAFNANAGGKEENRKEVKLPVRRRNSK